MGKYFTVTLPNKKCDKKDGFLKEEDFKDMNF